MSPKYRNAVAESIAVLGVAYAALPSWSAAVHVPAWVGLAIALLINVGNQLIKDSTPKPPISPT